MVGGSRNIVPLDYLGNTSSAKEKGTRILKPEEVEKDIIKDPVIGFVVTRFKDAKTVYFNPVVFEECDEFGEIHIEGDEIILGIIPCNTQLFRVQAIIRKDQDGTGPYETIGYEHRYTKSNLDWNSVVLELRSNKKLDENGKRSEAIISK